MCHFGITPIVIKRSSRRFIDNPVVFPCFERSKVTITGQPTAFFVWLRQAGNNKGTAQSKRNPKKNRRNSPVCRTGQGEADDGVGGN